MADSFKASQTGLATIDQMRRKKGWNKDAPVWIDAANELLKLTGGNVSRSTLQRFWRGIPIRQESFAAICKAVGMEDWTTIADESISSSLDEKTKILIGATSYVYDELTWVERTEITTTLLKILQDKNRILVLSGITGIGKTALAERLIAGLNDEKQFCRLNLDDDEITPDFYSSGIALLRALGEEATPEDKKDKKDLLAHILQLLQNQSYRLQIDSLENLLEVNEEGWSRFHDVFWQVLFQKLLAGNLCNSQVILTTQDIPGDLETVASRYPLFWHSQVVSGLTEAEQLEMFKMRGLLINAKTAEYLERIGRIYEGHPLILKVISEDLKACGGDVERYWIQGNFSELEANHPVQFSRRRLKFEVKQRVKYSLQRLPEDALLLLCRGSVYRRPVPESFWYAMLPQYSELQQQAALNLLKSRALVEEDWASDAWTGINKEVPLRQHNLIHTVAHELLASNSSALKDAEGIAALSWLTLYRPSEDSSNLSKLRGYIEAFHHFCNCKSFDTATHILFSGFFNEKGSENERQQSGIVIYTSQKHCFIRVFSGYNLVSLAWKLRLYGHYHELNELCKKLLKNSDGLEPSIVFSCLNYIGISYESLGRFTESIDWKRRALMLARQIQDRNGEGGSLINMGHSYKELGNYQKAIELYQKGLSIVREIGNSEFERNALAGLGNTYRSLGQYDQAMIFYNQALEVEEKFPDLKRDGSVLIGMGNLYANQEEYSRAIEYYQQKLDSANAKGNSEDIVIATVNLGVSYISLKEYNKALEYLQHSLALSNEIDASHLKMASLINLSTVYIDLDQNLTALDYLNQALELAKSVNLPKLHFYVLLNLAKLHQILKQNNLAQEYWNEAQKLGMEFPDLFEEEFHDLKQAEEKDNESFDTI